MARFKLHFFAFAWPFLYFWRYLVPGFDGVIWRLGNDFDNLYFDYKAYLLSALSSLNETLGIVCHDEYQDLFLVRLA